MTLDNFLPEVTHMFLPNLWRDDYSHEIKNLPQGVGAKRNFNKRICCILPLVVGTVPGIGAVGSGRPTCYYEKV